MHNRFEYKVLTQRDAKLSGSFDLDTMESANIGAATAIFGATAAGVPISTTHAAGRAN